jgi:dolichyl-phosphate beta-glucosyltransferase
VRAAERGATEHPPATPRSGTGPAGATSSGGTAAGPALTIVVPAYNEAPRLDVGMRRLQAAVDEGAVDLSTTELVVVDDGSDDGTAARAAEVYAHLPRLRVCSLPANMGKGAAVRAGVSMACGANVVFMDADMAIDPRQVPMVTDALATADVAIASRVLPGAIAEGDTTGRNVMGRVFNRTVNVVTGLGLGDTQCGFKGFRTPVARLLFHGVVVDRFAFDVGILVLARRLGLTVTEVPVRWRNVKGSRIRPVRDAWSMVSDMLRIRLGTTVAAPIEALGVAGAGAVDRALAAVRGAVGPTVPVLTWGDCGALALFPLGTPAEVAAASNRLAGAVGPSRVRRLAMSADQLADLAPLRVWAGTHGVADPGGPVRLDGGEP